MNENELDEIKRNWMKNPHEPNYVREEEYLCSSCGQPKKYTGYLRNFTGTCLDCEHTNDHKRGYERYKHLLGAVVVDIEAYEYVTGGGELSYIIIKLKDGRKARICTDVPDYDCCELGIEYMDD